MSTKRFFALFLCIVIMSALALPTGATTAVSKTASAARTYIYKNPPESGTWQQNVILAAIGVRNGSMSASVTPASSAKELAQAVILSLAASLAFDAPEDFNPAESLAEKQLDDGSYGDVDTTLLAIIALTASKTEFGSEKAVKYVISRQEQNGRIPSGGTVSDDICLTARAVTVLCAFKEDARVAAAIDSALAWLASTKNDNGSYGGGTCTETALIMTAVCDAGLNPNTKQWAGLLSLLLEYQRKDGSFIAPFVTKEDFKPDDLQTDIDATLHAYMAFDAADRNGSSVYLRLMRDGSLSKVHIADLKYGLITYGIFAGASVIFWIVIFVRNRHGNKQKNG